ncbi:hypothetical protein PVAP13_8KG085984 [Panicum virgatum]|uniref:Uncharacterized protein n=1 Tax=Panicum virgatum TaxID=38727 RepID=A0A8T0PKP8_PANVG|nr:hypothetical protein PVAP13_8KG085984 [Panicum virgatum]
MPSHPPNRASSKESGKVRSWRGAHLSRCSPALASAAPRRAWPEAGAGEAAAATGKARPEVRQLRGASTAAFPCSSLAAVDAEAAPEEPLLAAGAPARGPAPGAAPLRRRRCRFAYGPSRDAPHGPLPPEREPPRTAPRPRRCRKSGRGLGYRRLTSSRSEEARRGDDVFEEEARRGRWGGRSAPAAALLPRPRRSAGKGGRRGGRSPKEARHQGWPQPRAWELGESRGGGDACERVGRRVWVLGEREERGWEGGKIEYDMWTPLTCSWYRGCV